MRLWSLHPRYLDRRGLVACWREALLAQAVLAGRTRGYTSHPQLLRFRESGDSVGTVGDYLSAVADEADARNYRFDRSRIDRPGVEVRPRLVVSTGQLALEWMHLRHKLAERAPDDLRRWESLGIPLPHPLFHVVEGPIAPWERATVLG